MREEETVAGQEIMSKEEVLAVAVVGAAA